MTLSAALLESAKKNPNAARWIILRDAIGMWWAANHPEK